MQGIARMDRESMTTVHLVSKRQPFKSLDGKDADQVWYRHRCGIRSCFDCLTKGSEEPAPLDTKVQTVRCNWQRAKSKSVVPYATMIRSDLGRISQPCISTVGHPSLLGAVRSSAIFTEKCSTFPSSMLYLVCER